MAEHHYKFNVKMTCGGCSGAVERVLKKLDGEFDLRLSLLPSSASQGLVPVHLLKETTADGSSNRRQRLLRLAGYSDRRRDRRRVAIVRNGAREDQEDWQAGQLWRGRWCHDDCMNLRLTKIKQFNQGASMGSFWSRPQALTYGHQDARHKNYSTKH
jgi:copper chaperone CopZ